MAAEGDWHKKRKYLCNIYLSEALYDKNNLMSASDAVTYAVFTELKCESSSVVSCTYGVFLKYASILFPNFFLGLHLHSKSNCLTYCKYTGMYDRQVGWHMMINMTVFSSSRCGFTPQEGGFYFNQIVNCSLSHVMCHRAVGSCMDDNTAQNHCTAI